MARFFMAGTNIEGGRAIIRGQDAEHIRVLRMRPGEDVVICDGRGTDYRCRLVSSGPEEAEAEVIEVVPCKGEPGVEVTVYAGLPKGERADFLVQKCIEAGASRIVFFNCERCVARPDGRSMAKKLERFARIAEAAAQQSGRGKIPAVVTGPEGGFTEAEAKMAKVCGMTLCSMGERILRCETAPVIAVGAIMYAAGEL